MAAGGKQPEVRFTVSERMHDYLTWLTENTVLGKSENEVAQQVLTSRLARMKEENYKPGPDLRE